MHSKLTTPNLYRNCDNVKSEKQDIDNYKNKGLI